MTKIIFQKLTIDGGYLINKKNKKKETINDIDRKKTSHHHL